MLDNFGREIDYLRISVTDRCNLRCIYCMPKDGVEWIPHENVLTFEEILRLCRVFAALGVRKIKLTGGEPLVRHGIAGLIRDMKSIPGIKQITLTTNGVLFAPMAEELVAAGLDAVTFSIDSLKRDCYADITRFDHIDETEAAIRKAMELKLPVKLNCVPLRGVNEEELPDLAVLARDHNLQVRMIELMPIGCGKQFSGIPFSEILTSLEERFGPSIPCSEALGNGPASYVSFEGFKGHIGFITALTHPFCGSCNRVRLTSSGFLKLCLNHPDGVELLPLLRGSADDEELKKVLTDAILRKPLRHHFEDRGVGDPDKMNSIGG